MTDDAGPKRFRVVEGSNVRRAWSKRDSHDFEQLVCRVCEIDIGVATSTFIETHHAPHEQNGQIIRTTKGLMCAYCLSRGKITHTM